MSEIETSDLPLNAEPVVEPAPESNDPLGAAIDKAIEIEEERARDERGRFASKTEDKATPSIEPASADTAESSTPSPKPAQQPLEAPGRWTDADKAKFAALPREAQETLLDRHKAMEADYTRKSQDIAEFRKSAEPLVQAVQPFQQYLGQLSQQIGVSPPQMIHAMLGTEYRLRTGTPEQKVAALASLASEYGIDLAAMSRGEGAQPNPLVDNLRQTVSQLSQRLNHFEQSSKQQTDQQIAAEITAFENAKDADGSPKYPHYQRVKGVMGHLIGNGEVATLEQAYEAAVAPIKEAIADEMGRRQKSAEEANAEAVEKARRAQPVRTSGTQPNGTAKSRGLDALLDKTLTDAGFV